MSNKGTFNTGIKFEAIATYEASMFETNRADVSLNHRFSVFFSFNSLLDVM